jgi:hypothetical protein
VTTRVWKKDLDQLQSSQKTYFINHSMLRLDATTKKRYDGKLFNFKKFSIKQVFFIHEIFSSRVKAAKQKKI